MSDFKLKQHVVISVPNQFHSYNGCTGVVTGFVTKEVPVKFGLFHTTYEDQQWPAVKLDMNGPTIHVSPTCLKPIRKTA